MTAGMVSRCPVGWLCETHGAQTTPIPQRVLSCESSVGVHSRRNAPAVASKGQGGDDIPAARCLAASAQRGDPPKVLCREKLNCRSFGPRRSGSRWLHKFLVRPPTSLSTHG